MKNMMNARFFRSPGSRMDSMISEATRVLAPRARRVFWALRRWCYAAPTSDVARHLHGMECGDVMGICTLAALTGREDADIVGARAHVGDVVKGARAAHERYAVQDAWRAYRETLTVAMDIAMATAVREIRSLAGHGGSISLDSPSGDESDDDDGYAWLGHEPTREREVALAVDMESLGIVLDDADIEEGRVPGDVYDRLARDIGLARDVYERLGGRRAYTRDSVLRGAIRRAARR